MRGCAIALLFAATALGQNTDHTFTLKNTVGAKSLNEMVVTLRTVGEIYKVSTDEAASTLAMEGAPDQVALAAWLIPRMDAAQMSGARAQEYRVAGSRDDVVLIYQLEHTTSPGPVQEIVTTLRTVAEIHKVYALTGPRMVILRGDAGHVALAKFFLSEADQPAQPRPDAVVHEFKVDDDRLGTGVVYGLAHAVSPQAMQEIITILRAVGDIRNIFMVTGPKLLAIRGSAGEVQLAEWLIAAVDTGATKASGIARGNETRMPGPGDEVVRVFYLAHSGGVDDLVAEMRTTTHINRIFASSAPPAIVLRGTAEQVAAAARWIEASGPARP